METEETVITMTNSTISFAHDIAIGIGVVIEYGTREYFVNSTSEASTVSSTYSSLDAFLTDVNTNGYSGMIVMDANSAIQ